MKAPVVFSIFIILFGCATALPSKDRDSRPGSADQSASHKGSPANEPSKPVKSPHGYIIDKDYDLGRFGGFVGECTDDQNWPYFWQCMSERSGNGGFK